MIRVWVLVALVGVILAGAWYVDRLQTDLAQVRADLDQARAAAEAVDRFTRAQAARDLAAAELDKQLQEGVGADAPLSDYLRGAVGRVW